MIKTKVAFLEGRLLSGYTTLCRNHFGEARFVVALFVVAHFVAGPFLSGPFGANFTKIIFFAFCFNFFNL